uniref:Sema domain-containing protein n=1 Tax=Hucho hucho TaxID=62062 RepID=A0A4W5MVF2_9TELE
MNMVMCVCVCVCVGKESACQQCVYSLADITKVFATGGFRDMKKNCVNSGSPDSVPNPRPGQCINDVLRAQGYNSSFDMPDRVLQFAKEHPLLTDTVDAVPLLVRRGTTYTRITATNISNSDAALLHLGTDKGELHSVSVVGRTATLLQEIPLITSVEPVNNILIHQGHVVVSSPSSLSRMPVEGCRVYSSCQVCARAAGLGCVWDVNKKACVADSPVQRESEDPLKVCGTGEGCITTGCDWESQRAAHIWPSIVWLRVWPGSLFPFGEGAACEEGPGGPPPL